MGRTIGLIVAATVLSSAQVAAGQMTFYVAENGGDMWTGRLPSPNRLRTDGPFAGISRARDAVRKLKATGSAGPITVLIRKGTYHLSEPLVFTPEDSGTDKCPIVYGAYPGEKPVISGSRPISGWKPYRGRIWYCTVPALDTSGAPARHLFYRGKEQDLARYPNRDPKDPVRRGWMYTQLSPTERTFIQWMCRPPDWVEYETDIPADGEYRLWVRYAGHPGTAKISLSVDGGTAIPLKDLPTEDYQKFVWSSAVASVRLTNGRHTLRFTALASHNGFYPDAWVFSDDPGYLPETNSVAADKHVVRVEAEAFVRKQTRIGPTCGDPRDTLLIGYYPSPNQSGVVCLPVRRGWESASQPEIVVFQPDGADWLTNVLPFKADPKTEEVKLGMKSLCGLSAGRRCYVRNIFAELDSPGEWYLDNKTSTLYFWPPNGKKPRDGEVTLAVLDRLVEFKGDPAQGKLVSNVHLRGLAFRETTAMELGGVEYPADGTIRLSGAAKCSVENCGLIDLAANAVLIDPSCRDCSILGSKFARIGANGILQPPADERAPKDFMTRHRIAGNEFSYCSQLHKGCAAVQLYYGGNVIEYNSMHDQPRWAVALPFSRGGHNTVRYNEMRRTCLETGDCGPIHVSRGTNKDEIGGEICYNLIVDSPGMTTDSSGRIASPNFGWGIYLDGFASGYHVHHNVVANNSYGGILIHGGDRNIIENNIFLNSSYYQCCLGVGLNSDMNDNKIVRNVFYYTGKKAVLYYCMGSDKPKAGNIIDSNLYYHQGLPLEVIYYDGSRPDTDSWNDWNRAGFDTHSLIADPMFEDLKNGDYRPKLRDLGSKLGFEQIDLSRTGLKGYRR